MKKTFVTTINCMDGRIQMPVNQYMRQRFDAEYVDTITEAGPNRILALEEPSDLVESIKRRCELSIDLHDSEVIAIVGHVDCGGNRADDNTQKEHIKIAKEKLKKWFDKTVIIGLWLDETWTVKEI